MKKLHPLLLVPLFSAALLSPLSARDAAKAPSVDALRETVLYLASPELEGRMTGSEGAKKAADFLAAELQKAGIAPGGENGTYFQEFEFTDGVRVDAPKNHLSLLPKEGDAIAYEVEKAFRPLAFAGTGEIEGEVVVAGYGLRTPGDGGYDSYADLDVKDKIVVVFRYVPEGVSVARRAELNRYAGLRYKALIAREQGAKALLVITGPNSPGAGELVSIETDAGNAGSEILAASISQEVAAALFAKAGKDLKAFQAQLDEENPHAEAGFAIPDLKVKLATAVERVRRKDRNVIGILPPTGRFSEKPEYVATGGHYDHLGHGEVGAMKHKGEEHSIHYGADDNASGTAVVLELAKAEAAARKAAPERDARGVIFAFWSGEEIGIIGSSHFAEKPTVAIDSIVAYLNFDMVGRLRENKLSVQGTGSSPDWKKLVEKRNVVAGFNLSIQEDPYLPTDSTAFYPKGVPILCFFTGAHEDYHRPTDTPDLLNYEGLDRITRFAGSILGDLVVADERLPYAKVERSQSRGGSGSREQLRATIGTIPDYAAEGNGVKISGVRAGAPADKAGLQGGDLIVEFAGQKIANIYDYTYALDAVKIGTAVDIVVERDGKRVSLSVVPEGRK